jgi:citrate lyase gamma subunit
VDLTLASAPEAARAGKIAAEFGKALKVENVSVAAGAQGVTLSARVPGRSSRAVEAAARSFAQVLTEQGVAARESVRPVRERVSTNLFAYAADQVREIRVNRQGKSSEQVAEEIRQQLEAAGLRNASVEVTDEAGTTQIMITGQCDETTPNPCDTRIVLEGEPEPPNKAMARIQCDASMTDAEKCVEIRRQLLEQGVEADVEVVNGKITVHPRR